VLNSRPFPGQCGDEPLDERFEAGNVDRIGVRCLQVALGEDLAVEKVGQALSGRAAGEKCGEHCDSPRAALGGDLADRDETRVSMAAARKLCATINKA
jgi:hypothetical protein